MGDPVFGDGSPICGGKVEILTDERDPAFVIFSLLFFSFLLLFYQDHKSFQFLPVHIPKILHIKNEASVNIATRIKQIRILPFNISI